MNETRSDKVERSGLRSQNQFPSPPDSGLIYHEAHLWMWLARAYDTVVLVVIVFPCVTLPMGVIGRHRARLTTLRGLSWQLGQWQGQ